MKLIHLSDTHIGKDNNLERLEIVVNDLITNPPEKDTAKCIVLHTGDLIDKATDENRIKAKKILDRLSAAGYQVLLCPGNHDYGNSYWVNRQAADKFQHHFSPYLFHDQENKFPTLLTVEDKYIFIGLDSNAAELNFWQHWFAEGHIGRSQLTRLNQLLDSEIVKNKKIIVYLHHHPFYYEYSVAPDVSDKNPLFHLLTWITRPFRRLKDAYSFCQVIRDRVHLICFGHKHFGLDCSSESRKYGIKMALDGSSTTCSGSNHDRMRYRIVDLDDFSYQVKSIKLP